MDTSGCGWSGNGGCIELIIVREVVLGLLAFVLFVVVVAAVIMAAVVMAVMVRYSWW